MLASFATAPFLGPRSCGRPSLTFAFQMVGATFVVGLTYSLTTVVSASHGSGDDSDFAESAVAPDPGPPLDRPPEVVTHGQLRCGKCVEFEQDVEWVHQAMEFLLPKTGNGPGWSEDPMWHPNELKPGLCWEVHGYCGGELSTGEAQSVAELQAAIARGAAARDIETLARLVDLPSVAVVPERTAIQVIGCDGQTVVGHVPVESGVLTELRAVRADLDH